MTVSSASGASLPGTTTANVVITNDDSGVTYAVACQSAGCESLAEGTTWTTSLGTVSTTQVAGDTTLSLALGVGAALPPSGAPFYIRVESEVEKVTSWTGSGPYTLTVSRAQLGTSAARHASPVAVTMPGGSAANATTYALKITATGNVAGTVKYETVADARPGAKPATIGASGATCAQGVDVVYAGATDTPLSLTAPGTQNFTVTICSDGVFEYDETFAIKLFDAATAVAGASASPTSTPTYLYLTITNDELTPSIVVADANPTVEGNSGSTNHAFTVTRWGPSEVTTDATYAVTGSGTYAAAAADFDGAALPSGSITQIGASYAASASVTVNVPVAGDTAPESPETYTLTLSGVSPATSATLLDATGLGTILNDDTQVSITAQNGAGLLEGQTYAYLLELSNVGGGGSYTSVTGVQIAYTVTGGSGLVSGATCTGTVDVTPATSTLTMSSSSDYVYIPLCSDVTAEADESVTVTFAPTNAVLSGAATRTFSIYDDDKTIAVKTLQDANANGIDNADAALGGVTVDIYVDGTDTDGTGANGSFDAASDYLLTAKRVVTSTAAKTLGTGTFSGLRNLTYFVVETDPTATYADISSTAALCGGTQSGTAAAAITAAATSISVTETVNPGTLPRNLCIDSELVTLTARSGDVNPRTYTVPRGVAGSVAAAHLSGAIVTTTMSTPVTGLAAPYANNTVKVTFDPTTAAVAGATTPVRFLDARKIASVSGSVLHDTDASGVIERTETEVIEGAALTLFRDSNGNGTFEPGSDSSLDAVTGLPLETTSDAFGAFSFENLLAGTYFIVETDLSTPSVYGSTAVSPTQGATPPWTGLAAAYRFNVIKVTLASGTGSSSGNQFLDSVAGGTIAGRVLDDVDASSTESAGDTALGSNVSVVLYRDQNGNGTLEPSSDLAYDSANTMSAYSFGAIMQGTYFLVETDLAGYASTTAIVGTGTGAVSSIPAGLVAPYLNNEIKIVVTSPTATSSENLFLDSLANASIWVSVFDDTNVDGILDVTETTNVSGATVKLYRDNPIVAAGNVGTFNVATDFLVDTKTTVGAELSYTGLVKGTYFIVETNVATWTSTGVVANAAAGASTDGDNDRNKVAITALNLASTGSAFLDALATGTITGFVNEDVN
ncbi:MAG: beta strand repeat-containing protein, partial [Ilumatobacteraceae bacterium]